MSMGLKHHGPSTITHFIATPMAQKQVLLFQDDISCRHIDNGHSIILFGSEDEIQLMFSIILCDPWYNKILSPCECDSSFDYSNFSVPHSKQMKETKFFCLIRERTKKKLLTLNFDWASFTAKTNKEMF